MGGGGGGGAVLIAASGTVTISGSVLARGGNGGYYYYVPDYGTYWSGTAGAGSGGAIRLVGTTLSGGGTLDAGGGTAYYGWYSNYPFGGVDLHNAGGSGRIRLDGLNIFFNGPTTGVRTSGMQPVIVPQTNQIASIVIQSIAGVAVSASPTGVLTTPGAVIPGQQASPVPVVVHCSNLPMSTPITVTVVPASGAALSAVGYNSTGTQASSSATILLSIPRGGGRLYATVAAAS
jgi:hypothetical protein